MIFETLNLTPPLAHYVESVFHFKDFIPDHSIERVVPTGHIFIIFELDNIPRNTFEMRSLKVYLINSGYCILSLTIMGVILGPS